MLPWYRVPLLINVVFRTRRRPVSLDDGERFGESVETEEIFISGSFSIPPRNRIRPQLRIYYNNSHLEWCCKVFSCHMLVTELFELEIWCHYIGLSTATSQGSEPISIDDRIHARMGKYSIYVVDIPTPPAPPPPWKILSLVIETSRRAKQERDQSGYGKKSDHVLVVFVAIAEQLKKEKKIPSTMAVISTRNGARSSGRCWK